MPHILASLAGNDKVTQLTLERCEQIDDDALILLRDLPSLSHVTLDECDALTPAGIGKLGEIKTLRGLGLSTSYGKPRKQLPAWIQAIAGLTLIEELSITGCHELSDGVLAPISTLGRLRSLSLLDCESIESCAFIPQSNSLKNLYLRACHRLQGDLSHILALRQLESLEISGNYELGDDDLTRLGSLNRLRELSLKSTDIGTKGLAAICEGSSRLEKLSLENCYDLPGEALSALAGLSELSHLNLSAVKLRGHLRFLKVLGKLRYLDLTDCELDAQDLAVLAGCKQLEELDFTPFEGEPDGEAIQAFFEADLPAVSHYVLEQGLDEEGNPYYSLSSMKEPSVTHSITFFTEEEDLLYTDEERQHYLQALDKRVSVLWEGRDKAVTGILRAIDEEDGDLVLRISMENARVGVAVHAHKIVDFSLIDD